MRLRLVALLLVLAAAITADGAPKRRAASKPSLDPSTPAGWLTIHGTVLTSTELSPYSYDLEALERMVGDATVVGLGDATHGTHEFYTTKLRMADFLVRRMGFEVIAFEGPFPVFEQLNQWVQTGVGDPRPLLEDLENRLAYPFWNVAELLAVVEWARAYNLARGDRPPLEVAGFDVYDEAGAVAGVLAYLRRVDPAAAARAEQDYACVLQGRFADKTCQTAATETRDRIAAQREPYVAASSARAYEDGLQYATVVTQYFGTRLLTFRDEEMARNAKWVQQHRGTSGKVILWAHQEHIRETPSSIVSGKTMGTFLAADLGSAYFTIGSLTGDGRFTYWVRDAATGGYTPAIGTFPPPPAGTYEAFFRTRGIQALLVPLDHDTPSWLSTPAVYRTAGTIAVLPIGAESLPAALDAVVYIDSSTPTTPLH